MPNELRDPLIVGALLLVLILCGRLLGLRLGLTVRPCSIRVRPAVFAEIGVVLLFVGVSILVAIAAGAIPSSPVLSAIIVAILGVAIVCFVYSAILLLLYVPLPKRRQRKSVQDGDL
jgi:uncharacterized membrane protein YczE